MDIGIHLRLRFPAVCTKTLPEVLTPLTRATLPRCNRLGTGQQTQRPLSSRDSGVTYPAPGIRAQPMQQLRGPRRPTASGGGLGPSGKSEDIFLSCNVHAFLSNRTRSTRQLREPKTPIACGSGGANPRKKERRKLHMQD